MIGCCRVKRCAWSLPGSRAVPVNPSTAGYECYKGAFLFDDKEQGLLQGFGLGCSVTHGIPMCCIAESSSRF